MGAVWGVVSGKFVITAAGLLIASRIDQGPVQALIDPHVAQSAVSRDFAERRRLVDSTDIRQTASRHSLSIGIGAEEFDERALRIVESPPGSGADMVLGRDALEAHVFALDLRHRELALLEKGDVTRLAKRFIPVPVSLKENGRFGIPVSIDGQIVQADIDLGQADPLSIGAASAPAVASPPLQTMPIQIGKVVLREMPARVGAGDTITLGLRAFDGRTLVLDLPHGKLWVSAGASAGQ